MATFVTSPIKSVGSIITINVDFVSSLTSGEGLTAIVVTSVVASGVDASPSSILLGAPSIAQNVASQTITGGTSGVVYLLGFNGTTNNGNQLIIYTYIAVISADPFKPV